MTNKSIRASSRKDAHIDLALDPETNSEGKNSFDRMRFTHCALPELDIAAIDLTSSFLGRRLSAPMMALSMRALKDFQSLLAPPENIRALLCRSRPSFE